MIFGGKCRVLMAAEREFSLSLLLLSILLIWRPNRDLWTALMAFLAYHCGARSGMNLFL